MTGLDTIKLCFFFFLSLSSPLCVLLRECTGGFPMTGFGSLCQPATAVERGGKAFSGLSSSSLCDKRLLCSTHTVGRPLTGLLQLAGRGLSVSELTRTEIWQKKDKMTTFSWIFEQPAFQATVCKVGPSTRSLCFGSQPLSSRTWFLTQEIEERFPWINVISEGELQQRSGFFQLLH